MTGSSDDPRTPEPEVGLIDPRSGRQGPEILGAGAAIASGTGRGDDPAVGAPGGHEEDGPDVGAGGLIDPRDEIPDPAGP